LPLLARADSPTSLITIESDFSFAFLYIFAGKNKIMDCVLSIIGFPTYSFKKALAPFGVFARHIRDHFIPHAGNNYRPHVLSHRSLSLMSGLLVALKIFTLTAVTIGPIVPAFSSAITVSNIISLTNESRGEYQLPALTENPLLDQAAQTKANDMLAKGYFAHTTPDGKTPWDFIVAAGYNYIMAGENLAVNFTEAENVETAWMNSPGHKANIVNKNYEEIGIGISQGEYQGHNAIFVVQMFGTPAGQKISMDDQPTKVQPQSVPQPQPAPVKVAAASPAPAPAPAAATVPTPAPAPAPIDAQTLGANQNQPAAAPVVPVNISDGSVNLNGDQVNITAKVEGPAVKAIAYFGEQAIMLSPTGQGTWGGEVALSTLAEKNTTVTLKAFDIDGNNSQFKLADFSTGTVENYNLIPQTADKTISLFGHSFNPKDFENRFLLFFIAGILASLILAIGLKRHVQHLSLIANSSFVVIFAALLWWVR